LTPSRDALFKDGALARGISIIPLETLAEVQAREGAVSDQSHIAILKLELGPNYDKYMYSLVEALNVGDWDLLLERAYRPFFVASEGDKLESHYQRIVIE